MRITKRQLRRIIREETAKATKQYDDDSALKGDQSKLPDGLQKGIIDKTVEDREEAEDEKKNEVRRLVRQMLREMTMAPGGGDPSAELASAVQELVDDGNGLFDFKKMLMAMGYQDVDVTTSPVSMVMVRVGGESLVIASSGSVEPGPNDHIVGKYVVGRMG